MAEVLAISMFDNPDITEFLKIMQMPVYQSERIEFTSMLKYVDTITKQYESIMTELSELKEQFGENTDKQNPLSVMVEKLSSIVSGIGEKLKALKDNIFNFSKNFIENSKNQTLSAVGSVAGFLHIGEGLQAVSESLSKAAAKVENLELLHAERAESKLLTDLKIPSNLESLSQDDLKTVYAKLLDIGMNEDLSPAENAFLQDMTEEIESLLPERVEFENTQEQELETEQGVEI